MNIFAGHCVTQIVDTVCNNGILIKIGETTFLRIVFKTKAVLGIYCQLALCNVIPDGGCLFCDTNIHPGYDLTFL